MLFIDSPIGTGYSYVGSDASYVTTLEEMTYYLYEVLIFLQEKFNTSYFNPKRDFYIFGDDYSGKYIPIVGSTIIKHNLNTTETKLNLKGVGIGDGFTDPLIQWTSYNEYALSWGLVD